MTTIAYRDGVLAADRLITQMDARCGEMRKVVRSPAGHLAGAAGTIESITRFLNWVEAGAEGDPPNCGRDGEGILVYPNGRVVTWTGGPALMEVSAPFHAGGCGWRFAIGAMHAGANARRAVEIAIEGDTQSGGGVDMVRLRKVRK